MLTTLFYRLPRLTALAILVVFAGGLGAILTLGRQEDPTLVERFGYVLTTLPGADAERVEALLTDPIETALRELSEIELVTSTSRANVSQVSIDMDENLTEAEVDNAWNLVRQQVEIARPLLPEGASVPEVERVYVGASTLLVALTWEATREPELAIMARMARDLEDALQNLPGTEETQVYGLPSEEIRIITDIDALGALGMSVRDAAGIIAAADARTPAGQLRAGDINLNLEVNGEFDTIARIRAAPLVQNPDGTLVRVGDVADVTKGLRDPPDALSRINNKPAIIVGAFIQTNQRVDQWASGARAAVARFTESAPSDISIEVVFDQSEYTEERLNGLATNLGFSALIVFAVLFFAMGWRSAIVVGSALPLTVCLVLILFNTFNIPLHQMSVTGLVISLGLLIDNAIVVIDEYDQMRARGTSRLEAIDYSLRHLFAPLAASTLTTALAFLPIAVLPGSAGEFIGMIGTSVIFSVVSSLFVAMLIVPALGGWLDGKRTAARERSWWRDGVAINWISDGYRWTVERVLRFPPLGLAIGIVPAMIGIALAGQLPLQFFPQTERDQIQLDVLLPSAASIEETQAVTRQATDIILGYEGVERVYWTLGEPAPRVYYNAFNNAEGVTGIAGGWIQLDSPERTRELVSRIQSDMRTAFPNAQFLALPFEQGPPIAAPIEVFIKGDDLATLSDLGDATRKVLSETPGVTYTNSSLLLGAPKVTFRADEAATAMVGQGLGTLAGDINAELEGVLAGSILEGVEELPVRVIAGDLRRSELSDLRSKSIGVGPGDLGTPLSALGTVTLDPDTSVITRRDGRRVNVVQGFMVPYALPAPALSIFERKMDEAAFTTPSGYSVSLGGEAEARGDALTNLTALAVPLILIITGAVALVFNSFRMAFLVLLSGMLSVGMAFFGVWIFNLPLGFMAIVGALGLLGIAINGSIVVLTQLRSNPACLEDDVLAQRETVVDATRHIVATTLTTMGGFLPLILAGDAFWLPLATAIAGGVAGSALLALYFTPAAFRLTTMRPFSRMLAWALPGRAASAQPAE